MSELPKDYDVIICGTGLTESIVSAALSRIGKTVLHIDRQSCYGGEFGSYSLTGLIEWIEKIKSETQSESSNLCNNILNQHYYTNLKFAWNKGSCSEKLQENLPQLSRRFSIDLCPNIFYSRGSFIELLISSDVSKYCEFRMVSQILTLNEKKVLEKVPTSRSDVFKTDQLSMIEKRHMMKFIQSCMKENDFKDFVSDKGLETISFTEFIKSKKLPESVNNYIINAVAMCPSENQNALEGLTQVKKFLSSVGRFGDSPFLFSSYGTGELPQCYCRLSAVFGTIFHLNMTINDFQINKETKLIESISAKTCDKKELAEFNCKYLIMDSTYVPLEYFTKDKPSKQISRGILLTDKSIFINETIPNEENISLLFLPKTSEKISNVYCLEASSASQSCPKGYHLIYLFCENSNAENPEEDFKEFIDHFIEVKALKSTPELKALDEPIYEDDVKSEAKIETMTPSEKPRLLFECYFSHYDSKIRVDECFNNSMNLPANLFITTGANSKLDFDDHVNKAREIFKKICPDEEFLPKPPDQEDIIFDYGDESDKKESVDEIQMKDCISPCTDENLKETITKTESPEITQPEKKSRVLSDDTESEDKS